MIKQLLRSDAVKRSIYSALQLTGECSESIARVKDFISNMPDESLLIRRSNPSVRFYYKNCGCEVYLPKSSPLLYKLCRKRYLVLLLHALELRNEMFTPHSSSTRQISNINADFEKTVDKIMCLLDSYSKGNLDIARIVLTSAQYKWYTGKYRQKIKVPDIPHFTDNKICVRSKSERDIGNAYESCAVPYHYEEMLVINAAHIVKKLQLDLRDQGFAKATLCYEKKGSCYWDVPPALQWMNSPGSIWRAYKPVTGKIIIYNDFHIMLADGQIVIHEHDGKVDEAMYRCNASERVYVMRMSGAVNAENLISTFESDVQQMDEIIRRRILPRLWF